jgi:putative FmdB family regulatory protein
MFSVPLYDYLCSDCGTIEDVWAGIEESNLNCPLCQGIMSRLISPCNIKCDLTPYFDENLADPKKAPHGQWVKSRQHRKKLMKEQGLAEFG